MIGPSLLTWAQQPTASADALAAPMGLVAYTPFDVSGFHP